MLVPAVDPGIYNSKSYLGGSLLRDRFYWADLDGVLGRPWETVKLLQGQSSSNHGRTAERSSTLVLESSCRAPVTH